MPLAVEVTVQVMWVSGGTGSALIEDLQANVSGQGQTNNSHPARIAQFYINNDWEGIPVAPGSEGSVTLANIKTAIDAASTALAGAGSPKITAADLGRIQSWASGGT